MTRRKHTQYSSWSVRSLDVCMVRNFRRGGVWFGMI